MLLKDITDATDPPLKRKRVEKICDFITSKRIQYTKTLDELVKLDLEKLLLQTLLGLSVLRGYEIHSILKSAEKISLVEVVIDWVLIRCENPGYEIYKLLQKKIKTLFPNEDEEIYYVSPKDHNKKKTVIRGKLYNRVKNRREWMIQKGLLNEEETVQNELAEAEKNAQDTYMTDEILASINWLKIYKEETKELAKHWFISAPYRQEFLKNQSDNKITSYTDKFNVLKKTFGYKLIDIDFEYLFPQNKDTLANNWESFCRKLTKLIDDKDFTEKEAKVYKIALQKCLKEKDNPTSEDAKNLLMMKCLPTLLPATHKVRLEGKLQKPSAKHCREELFLHVETYNDIKTERKKRRDIAAKEGVSVQPYISYVGKNAVTVDAVYVCIDDFMYKSENFLQALSTCFKAFFALNLEYPPRTKHFWCFLERVVFKMKESQDYMPNVIALEGEFRVLS